MTTWIDPWALLCRGPLEAGSRLWVAAGVWAAVDRMRAPAVTATVHITAVGAVMAVAVVPVEFLARLLGVIGWRVNLFGGFGGGWLRAFVWRGTQRTPLRAVVNRVACLAPRLLTLCLACETLCIEAGV